MHLDLLHDNMNEVEQIKQKSGGQLLFFPKTQTERCKNFKAFYFKSYPGNITLDVSSHKAQKSRNRTSKTTDDLTPTRTHADLNQGLYENTSEAMYSEIFTIKKITDDINNLTDKSLNYTSSGESSPTESILMAPDIHDLMSHNNR